MNKFSIKLTGINCLTSLLFLTSCASGMEPVLTDQSIMSVDEYTSMITKHEMVRQELEVRRELGMRLSEFVKLENNQYKLDISKEDAIKLGISEAYYALFNEEIANTNKAIKEAIAQGIEVELLDIQARAKAYKEEINRSSNDSTTISSNRNEMTIPSNRNESTNTSQTRAAQAGYITTLGNEEGQDSASPLLGSTDVVFRCRTAAAFTPFYTCKTYAFGKWFSKVSVGSLFCTKVVTVPIAA